MTTTRRGLSLFWTITAMFLVTAVLGTLVQGLVTVAVLRPLETRETRARAELVATGLASDLGTTRELPGAAAFDTLLAHHRLDLGAHPGVLVYRAPDGGITTSPPEGLRFLARVLDAPTEPKAFLDRLEQPESAARLEWIVRRTVTRPEGRGQLLVVRPLRPRGESGALGSRTWLLFLPIALIASVAAGLLMLRLLVRRLRALETLAARVAEGDLSVRIADASGDEIGRLAERLDRMTERLAEARLQLEATERQRRQLFADITHELATPLTSIQGYTETMLDPRVPVSSEERARYLRGVLDESRRLEQLVRDLFELARLEAGASPLALERLDLAALCHNTTERFARRFQDAGLRLVWGESPAHAWVEADGHRIEQVLENLLVNALRYVPSGGTVELSLSNAAAAGDRFRLSVRDDGPGLPPEEVTLVFERFYRGAGARAPGGARDDGGSGLGLAIVREIVERHGGTVRARARAPHGLDISVELPAAA
jgi:signal transduction histidine kinase